MKKSKYLTWIDSRVHDLNLKKYIVTGANSGIGFHVARYLAYKNGIVIMACRNLEKAQLAKNEIKREFPFAQIEILKLDLSSSTSVYEFVKQYKKKFHTVDVLIHNAGVYHLKQSWTEDQFDIVMATNYLNPYLLNELMFPIVKERIIFTTSIAHKWGKIDYEDFYSINNYRYTKVYANSKFALSQYFSYLSKNHTNIKIYAAHPGICFTNLLDPNKGGVSKLFSQCGNQFLKLFMHSSKKAALSTFYAATVSNEKSGLVYGPRGLFHISGYPTKQHLCKKVDINQEKLIHYTKNLFFLKKDVK